MLRLFLLSPETVFAARVNATSFQYPIAEVSFDTVTTGAFGDISPGQTVLFGTSAGADDLGRSRVRKAATSDTLYFGRSSKGQRIGEVDLQDDAYITVLDLREAWAKIPFIEEDGVSYKDHDIAWTDQTDEPDPVANCGPAFAATIDGSDIITVDFSSLDSFAVADGATISSQLWDVQDGAIVTGTSSSAEITATFPAGFRYVSLTVTDSNGKVHTSYAPVYARDPANDDTIEHFFPEPARLTKEGQEQAFRIWDDLSGYPEGTLALFIDGEPADAADRSNVRFQGWTHTEPTAIRASRTATLADTTVACLDMAGRLDILPGFAARVENAETADSWATMTDLNIDKALHYLLHWHSTALELADYFDPALGSDWANVAFDSDGDTLWRQYQKFVNQLVPDRHLVCNTLGQLDTKEDPMVIDVADRTSTVQATLTEADWSDLSFSHQVQPRVHWLREGAVLTNSRTYDAITKGDIKTVFTIAPGSSPGQGPGQREDNIGLARTQVHLNETTGHRYARLNAPQTPFRVTLTTDAYPAIEPADFTWVQLTLSAATAAQRGLSFTEARFLPLEVNIRPTQSRSGLVFTTELTLERETSGSVATTVVQDEGVGIPDSGLGDDYFDDNFTGTTPSTLFYGDVGMYVLWDGARIFRTDDLLAEGGTVWEFIDSGVTGSILDLRYVIKSDNSVGAWLMTHDAIWWCDDIMAASPVWDDVLTIATVRAADATPTDGDVVFKTMAPYDSEPGYLIVATGPFALETDNSDYGHAYFWHTHDFGQNWTQVDMGILFGSRGYCYSSLYAMEIFRSEPGTIYCVRSPARIGSLAGNRDVAVFVSSDLGDTWARRSNETPEEIPTVQGFGQVYSLLHPFPSASDPSYVTAPVRGATTRPPLYRSHDEWVTNEAMTALDDPSGYGGLSPLWRVNKRTFDPNHVLGWFRHTGTSNYHLLESYDQGATWALLYNSGLVEADIPNVNTHTTGSVLASQHNTPNGWPADEEFWVLVRASADAGSTTDVIQTTDDNFGTLTSREGNLGTLLSPGGWVDGPAGGVALPRAGVNS